MQVILPYRHLALSFHSWPIVHTIAIGILSLLVVRIGVWLILLIVSVLLNLFLYLVVHLLTKSQIMSRGCHSLQFLPLALLHVEIIDTLLCVVRFDFNRLFLGALSNTNIIQALIQEVSEITLGLLVLLVGEVVVLLHLWLVLSDCTLLECQFLLHLVVEIETPQLNIKVLISLILPPLPLPLTFAQSNHLLIDLVVVIIVESFFWRIVHTAFGHLKLRLLL